MKSRNWKATENGNRKTREVFRYVENGIICVDIYPPQLQDTLLQMDHACWDVDVRSPFPNSVNHAVRETSYFYTFASLFSK